MTDDLGTWPRAQAEAIRDVLAEQGLAARLEQADGRVRVTVPEGQAGRAHRALAGQMSRVAAARRDGADPPQPAGEDQPTPLVLERFRRWGGLLAVVVAVMFVAVEMPAPIRIPAVLLTLLAIGAFRWWRGRDEEGRYGPGA